MLRTRSSRRHYSVFRASLQQATQVLQKGRVARAWGNIHEYTAET